MFKVLFKLLKWCVTAVVLFVVVTNFVVIASSAKYRFENVADVPEKQTALILGAAVYRKGVLSPVYQKRVEKAIELYQAKKVSKILASGDNSTVQHNEVNPVKNILLARGIPEADIFLDHAGFDTYSTMYRARDVFQVSSVIIVTQPFHLPRAVFIARTLGLEAYGVHAEEGESTAKNYLREIFANEKAVFDLILQKKPKYLGEVIPIQ